MSSEPTNAATRYDGLLTDEILNRAIAELESVRDELTRAGDPSLDGAWLVTCEGRIDNAQEDIRVVRDRFRKAQR